MKFRFERRSRFSTGVEIGAFVTKTNVSAAQFGEGSFDKGIIIRIPLESSSESTVGALHALFHDRPGEAKVLFDVERQGDFMVVMEAEGYNVMPDRNFIGRVEELCGRGSVRVIS